MPITTTSNDIIVAGHGSYDGGAANFTLPPHVDLYLILPVGYGLTDGPVTALVGRRPIDRLAIVAPTAVTDLQPMGMPTVFRAGGSAPNLTLYDLGDERTAVTGALPTHADNVFMVSSPTKLQDLLNRADVKQRIAASLAAQPGANVRLFWAGCAIQNGNPDKGTFVYCNATAVAFAASAHVRALHKSGLPIDAPAEAANAALDAAKLHPMDTAGAVAAAALHDAATAKLLHAL
jgi:hypothetical protein